MLDAGALLGARWRLVRLLGQGGLSEVWLAQHEELKNHVALKLLVVRRPKLAERLILEGRIQAQLRHPHIVPVTDVVRHEGYVGLVMEYVEGPTLDRFLETNGAPPLDVALELLSAVLAAVCAAHAHGVLHRDLKPSNILLARGTDGFVPKVADFGIAKVLDDLGPDTTRVGAAMGTPGYLAPEQATDASAADARADVFALGAIAYELISGRRAFPDATLDAAGYASPPRLDEVAPEVPASLADEVHRAMSLAPADRHDDPPAFAAALLHDRPALQARVAGTQPVRPLALGAATGSSPTLLPQTDPSSEPPSRRRMPALLVLAVVVASLTTGAWWWRATRSPAPGIPEPTEVPAPPAAAGALPAPARIPAVDVDREEPAPAAVEVDVAEPPIEDPPPPAREPATVPDAARPADDAPAPPDDAPAPPPAPEAPEPASDGPGAQAAAPEGAAEPAPPAPGATTSEPIGASPDDGVADAVATPPQAEPATDDAPTPATPPPSPPAVIGLWRGTANQLPFRLRILDQQGTRLTAQAVFVFGPTERKVELAGTLVVQGAFELTDPDGSFSMDGTVDGPRMQGTYTASPRARPLPFTASWTAR